jgi:hypothetical protein
MNGRDPLFDTHDDDEALLYNVVYCSRAADGVDKVAVDKILESAHRNNPTHGITGLLVVGGGIFFQWIEGPRDSIGHLMDNIRRDGRHHDLVELAAGEEVRERMFPNWDMELVSAQDIRDVLSDAQDTASDQRSQATLRRLIKELDSGKLAGLGT